MTRTLAATAILAATAAALGACSSPQEADTDSAVSAGMINDRCPIAGQPVNPDADAAKWQGGTVGFCCNGCSSRWDSMSDDERAAALAGVTD